MRTILIADDSTTIRRVVEHAFTGTDVRVLAAADGRAALELARRERPELVLCDVLMPGPSGYEVAEAIAADGTLAGTPVLLLTGAFEPFDEARAARCGALGFLSKPFESRTLRARVEEILSGAPPRPAAEHEPAEKPATRFADLFDALAADGAPIDTGPRPVAAAPTPRTEDVLVEAAALDDDPLGALAPGLLSSTTQRTAPQVDGVAPVALPGDEDFDMSRPPLGDLITAPQRPPDRDIEFSAAVREACRRAVGDLAPDVLREIAWEVVPDLLDRLLREQRAAAVPRTPDPRHAPPAGRTGDDPK